jgi:hypothetical protein
VTENIKSEHKETFDDMKVTSATTDIKEISDINIKYAQVWGTFGETKSAFNQAQTEENDQILQYIFIGIKSSGDIRQFSEYCKKTKALVDYKKKIPNILSDIRQKLQKAEELIGSDTTMFDETPDKLFFRLRQKCNKAEEMIKIMGEILSK